MTHKLGIDIGGTFTDFALLDEETGQIAIHKQLTTPHEPSECVLDGARNILATRGVDFSDVHTVVHGTTLVTNALIERKGALTGMLTTAGFRDVLDIAEQSRYDSYDWRVKLPQPLVSRDILPAPMRFEVHERIDHTGRVLRAVDLDEVRRGVESLLGRYNIESLAVCLLHSYRNPSHEQQIKALVTEEFPALYVSASAEVFPFMREYERFTTTSINAYVQPMVDRYLVALESGLAQQGFGGDLYLMASNAGTLTPATARRYPVRIMESGPTAGALMATQVGATLGLPNLLSYDTGGTTSKGCLILDRELRKTYRIETAQVHEFKKGSGLTAKTPVVDMIEIGAGGGSIAEVDDRGLLRVGPRSSGADPGPACYGRGGTSATLTDADLVLGYLNPEFFLGGNMRLDLAAAERSIVENVGRPLGLRLTQAAWGIHETINQNCARAFRIHASERMVDYRNCTMVAFGGSAPIRAVRVARKLKIPRVVLPMGAGVFSAFGLLISPMSFDALRTRRIALDALSPTRFADEFRSPTAEALDFLGQAGVKESETRLTRRLDMRYQGQGFEIEVQLPDASDPAGLWARLPELFSREYEKVFSLSFIEQPVEIVNWKVEATGPAPVTAGAYRPREAISAGSERKGERPAYVADRGSHVRCPVYDRYALKPGRTFEGPAIVEERESTCVLGTGDIARVDEHRNLVIEITAGEGGA